jgi:hypothetical protein
MTPDTDTEARAAAEAYTANHPPTIEGGRYYTEDDGQDAFLAGYHAGRAAGLALAAEIAEQERDRQIGLSRYGRLSGEDTAFVIAQAIRAQATPQRGDTTPGGGGR